MANNRIARVNELIKRELSQILLKEIEFPKDILVTVTRVETSANLIQTKVYISVMPEKQTPRVFQVLNQEIFDIQQIVNKRLKMRPVPKIKFVEEKKTKEAGKIEELLERLRSTLHPSETSPPSPKGKRLKKV